MADSSPVRGVSNKKNTSPVQSKKKPSNNIGTSVGRSDKKSIQRSAGKRAGSTQVLNKNKRKFDSKLGMKPSKRAQVKPKIKPEANTKLKAVAKQNISDLTKEQKLLLPKNDTSTLKLGQIGSGTGPNEGAPKPGQPGSGTGPNEGAPKPGQPGSGTGPNEGAPKPGQPGSGQPGYGIDDGLVITPYEPIPIIGSTSTPEEEAALEEAKRELEKVLSGPNRETPNVDILIDRQLIKQAGTPNIPPTPPDQGITVNAFGDPKHPDINDPEHNPEFYVELFNPIFRPSKPDK